MANTLEEHWKRREKAQTGCLIQTSCLWSLVNFLDFRHARSTRKLLKVTRSASRRFVGAGYFRSEEKLINPNEGSQEVYESEGRDASIVDVADVAKTSVKELMQKEMFREQDQNQQSSADIPAKEFLSEFRGLVKQNCKRTSKTSESSCDIQYKLDAAGNYRSENYLLEDSEEKTNNDVEHKWDNDFGIQSEQPYSLFDEKLIDAIKVFVDQTLTVGKHLTEDEKTESASKFMNSLLTLSSNKELILKLAKDPNSPLVKHIKDLEDSQVQTGRNPISLSKYNLINRMLKVSKPSEPVVRKQYDFFGRKRKSQEKIPLKGHENHSNTIVILKPGPASIQIARPEVKLSLLGLSRHEVQTVRIASLFSISKIKRKLMHAMGKEPQRAPSSDATPSLCAHQHSGSIGKGVGGEKGGWNSPNRNQFYNEEAEYSKLLIYNNLYSEAKKHLSEILGDRDETEEFSIRQLPVTLGRILSLPDFVSSPNFVTAQRFSRGNSFPMVNEDSWKLMQDEDPSHCIISRSCTTGNPENTVQSRNLNSDVSDEFGRTYAVEATLCCMRPDKGFEADVEIVEISDASVQEESKILDVSVEQCSSSVTDEQDGDLGEACDEDEHARCLKTDTFEEGQFLFSPLASPPSSSIVRHVGDLDSANVILEQPSPVSVLEPFFTDADSSITNLKSQPVEVPVQPWEIIFKEQLSSATNREVFVRSSMENEESSFDYVETVLLASGLNWEEFLSRWLSSDQILDASLFDEVELFSNRSRQDQMLLFGCTNEILGEVCDRYFGNSPWVSFVKRNIRSIPMGKCLVHEVWDGVEWYILSQPCCSTLDQIVRKDMAKTRTWMDLRFDVESGGAEIGEAIFDELVDDIIWSLLNEGPEIYSSVDPEGL